MDRPVTVGVGISPESVAAAQGPVTPVRGGELAAEERLLETAACCPVAVVPRR